MSVVRLACRLPRARIPYIFSSSSFVVSPARFSLAGRRFPSHVCIPPSLIAWRSFGRQAGRMLCGRRAGCRERGDADLTPCGVGVEGGRGLGRVLGWCAHVPLLSC